MISDRPKSLLFVSDVSPSPRFASQTIFHRHLCRLEDEGWSIHLLLTEADRNNYEGRLGWKVNFLPNRHWSFPPFRPYGALSELRYHALARHCASFVRDSRPNVIVGYLRGNYFSGFAAHLSRKLRLPLGYFYHDATELFPDLYSNPSLRERFVRFKHRLVSDSSVVWAVSDVMVHEENQPEKVWLLNPMPEDVNLPTLPTWKQSFSSSPTVVHAGTVYQEIVEPLTRVAMALEQIGGRLLLMTGSTEVAQRIVQSSSSVEILPALPAGEACTWICQNATALLVAYPDAVEQMPWIRSCFPSKFVQFTATGLPTLLMAPKGSALRDWADSRGYSGLLPDGTGEGTLVSALQQRFESGQWCHCAKECRQLWDGEFSPTKIHRQFADSLDRLIA